MVSYDTSPHARARTFGRNRGRSLSPTQAALMETLYPTIKITAKTYASLKEYEDVWLEVGFGAAEHLIWQAKANPMVAFLGVEPYLNGAAKAVRAVDTDGLDNIRVLNGDARDLMDTLPNASLGRIFVLFPDPWPKPRHNRRRIINDEFISEVHRILRPGGTFRFASDIIHYVDWSLTRILRHGGFEWPAHSRNDWRNRPDDWPQTRFEAKAIGEGRPCHYFEFIRR